MAERLGRRGVAEVLAALSLATDLANDHPMETALRSAVVAGELASELGLPSRQRADAVYLGLLRYLGCTSAAPLEARFTGDDIAVRKLFMPVDLGSRAEVVATTLGRLGRGAGPARRIAAISRALAATGEHLDAVQRSNCEAGQRLAQRMGMSTGVSDGLEQIFERHDGRGGPRGLAGNDLGAPVKVVHLATNAVLHAGIGGRDAALEMARRRRGGQLDPDVADAFCDRGTEILERLDRSSSWDRFVAGPWVDELPRGIGAEAAAAAFADFADLKSVFTLGHSKAVARLVERAAEIAGLEADERRDLRLAGLLHDLGRVSVPTGIWQKPGVLTAAEWERVRLHAYWTGRVLARAPGLEPVAALAASHHERLDGGGYPKNQPAAMLSPASRLLGAADVMCALMEARPHRPALVLEEARTEIEAEIAAGRLDKEAAAAVVEAAGGALERRAPWPADLSDREVEVLRLLAVAKTNKEIARALDISARTVQHHVAHIYDKIDVTTRVGAALFALEHGILAHPAL